MNKNPIGVFDSGVGGLTIVSEIKNRLPYESIIYVADQAYMPYGKKTKEEIVERSKKIVEFLAIRKSKAIVAACNTATVMAIDELRNSYSMPIIGTVPVIKTIAERTRTNNIAVFATPLTAKSTYLQDLIKKFAHGKKVLTVGESHLEDLIEEGIIDSKEIKDILTAQLKPLLSENVDAIALGCTHYPFVKDQTKEIVGDSVGVYDSGGAIARRLEAVLGHENLLSKEKGEDLYYTTGDKDKFDKTAEKLTGIKIKSTKINI